MTRLLLLITLLLSPIAVASELQVNEIYETYLPANKLLPVLEPMLGPEDRITAFRNKLVVRAPQYRQDRLLEILEEIDRPLRNVLIEVRFADAASQQQSRRGAAVTYQNAEQGVRIEGSPAGPDQVVVYRGSSLNNNIQVRAMARDSLTTRNENSLSQIRVLEGTQGFLQVGEETPRTHFVLMHPNGYGTTTEYRMVGNGIYVVPQIVKDKVRLELFTTQQKPQRGNTQAVEKTDAQSVLLVEPDVWTPFAGASTDSRGQDNARSINTRSLSRSNQNLELKVTILE